MTNFLQLQQDLMDVQNRINREIQFADDTQRQLVQGFNMLRENIMHMEQQVNLLFQDRTASLLTALGGTPPLPAVDATPAPAPEPSTLDKVVKGAKGLVIKAE